MRISVNLNDYVYVYLNQYGEKHWEEYWSVLPESRGPAVAAKRESNGRLRIQLHELMSAFGTMTHVGGRSPFMDDAVELI